MSFKTAVPSITQTPFQVAQAIGGANGTASLGKFSIAILVHNEEHEVLLHDSFVRTSKAHSVPTLKLEHIPSQEIDLRPAAKDENVGISVKSITEDTLTTMLGPVEIDDLVLLHAASTISARVATLVVFVACCINSAEVPDMCTSAMEWLPQCILQQADMSSMVDLLGPEGIGKLQGAREAWKNEATSFDRLPELVPSDFPSMVFSESWINTAETAPGDHSDSGSSTISSTESDDVEDVFRESSHGLNVQIEEQDDTLDVENLRNLLINLVAIASKQEEKLRGDLQANAGRDPDRRTSQSEPALVRGSRMIRKQREQVWADAGEHWKGPRFAIPAKQVDGRRYVTKVGKTKISLATEKALVQGKIKWSELAKVSGEDRLVLR